MDYNTAVREKLTRQKEVVKQPLMQDHKFQQTFYTQTSYEPRKFLWFKINKKVGEQIIPVGLCAICDKLEIEHDA